MYEFVIVFLSAMAMVVGLFLLGIGLYLIYKAGGVAEEKKKEKKDKLFFGFALVCICLVVFSFTGWQLGEETKRVVFLKQIRAAIGNAYRPEPYSWGVGKYAVVIRATADGEGNLMYWEAEEDSGRPIED